MLAGLITVLSFAAQGQDSTAQVAVLQGRVTDAQGQPVAGAKVYADTSDGRRAFSAATDSSGRYRIDLTVEGAFTVRAELAGYQSARFGPCVVRKQEIKTVDLTLHRLSTAEKSSPGAPEFYDQPHFTIAGVTDTTNLGGHASGMAGPSESLAKDIVPSAAVPAVPVNTASERAAGESAERAPDNFEANRRAGSLFLNDGKPREAVSYLERAYRLKPEDYETGYQLARAYTGTGEFGAARNLITKLLETNKNADLHHLLAEVDEKSEDSLRAVQEFQEAARLDPSEANLFDWGMELLIHRAIQPAIEVFSSGNHHFPQSARMLSALGVANYEGGSFEQALDNVGTASDLHPQDPNPYLLLGKMENADNGKSVELLTRLKRFQRLQPENPWANYYYALALWMRRKGPEDTITSTRVESLLRKAVQLDPKLAQGYLQLGNLYSEQKDRAKSISVYETAIQIDPELEQAHYRLAQAYIAAGETRRAQEEIERYKKISRASAEDKERERREIRQFVYTMQSEPAPGTPQ